MPPKRKQAAAVAVAEVNEEEKAKEEDAGDVVQSKRGRRAVRKDEPAPVEEVKEKKGKAAPKTKAQTKANNVKATKAAADAEAKAEKEAAAKLAEAPEPAEELQDEESSTTEEEEVVEKPKKGGRAKKARVIKRPQARKAAVAATVEAPVEEEEADENEEEEEEVIEEPKKRGRAAAKPKKEPVKKQTKPKAKSVKDDDDSPEQLEPKKLQNKTDTDYGKIDFSCTKKNSENKEANLKISSWNVGGLKAWVKKDGMAFIEQEDPDIFCLQETKCNEEMLPEELKDIKGYKQYWAASDKQGYAGVGLFTKVEPLEVKYGIEDEAQDQDGRCITAEYEKFYLVNVYVPNAGRKLVSLPKRLEWNKSFSKYINGLDKKKPVIISGDMNVAHNEIDLANPKGNQKNAGFSKEEREGMTEFLGNGFVDTFRELYPEQEGSYTFWTYMSNSRSKNVGWRLDYFLVSKKILPSICDSVIREKVFGSDHCPLTLFLNL